MQFPILEFVHTFPIKQFAKLLFKLPFYLLSVPFKVLFIFLLLLSYELAGLVTSS